MAASGPSYKTLYVSHVFSTHTLKNYGMVSLSVYIGLWVFFWRSNLYVSAVNCASYIRKSSLVGECIYYCLSFLLVVWPDNVFCPKITQYCLTYSFTYSKNRKFSDIETVSYSTQWFKTPNVPQKNQ